MHAIFSIHYSQIENKVESERHVIKVNFFTVRINPTLGYGSGTGWGAFEQCWEYQIFCGVNLISRTSPICFVLCSNKAHMDVF